MSADFTIPWVTTDEDGETAFASGHIRPPERFIRSLFASAAYDGWDDDMGNLDRQKMAERVTYTWWRERFPDDEAGEKCKEGDPDAEAITSLYDLYRDEKLIEVDA